MDWDDLRYFLTLARQGSLSGAARQLETTQPTMGRRLTSFEDKLGAQLFERTPSGLALTDVGRSIFDHAVSMEEAALAAQRLASGRAIGLSGSVRITAPEWFGARVLSPHLGDFCATHPLIAIELLTDARLLSLTRREADIVFRLRPLDQDVLIQRKILDMPFGLYATQSYLDRCGLPDFSAQGAAAHVVSMNEGMSPATADMIWLDQVLPRAHVAFRSNSRDSQAAAAAAGAGLVCLATALGDGWPGLIRVETPVAIPERAVWLGLHADTRDVPRIRALADYLVQKLQHEA